MTKEEFLLLLTEKEAIQGDVNALNNLLMQAKTQITANHLANTLGILNSLLEEVTFNILTNANISDTVTRDSNIKSIFNKNVINLNKNKGELDECN